MNPFVDGLQRLALGKGFLQKILNGFNVVVGRGFQCFDSRSIGTIKIICDCLHKGRICSGQWLDFSDACRLAEKKHPSAFDCNAIFHQAKFADNWG